MLPVLNKAHVLKHPGFGITERYFTYPEKVLQFGTGVLLRGLVDYLIDKANKQGIFEGRVVVVKSTDGPTTDFSSQDNLFTTSIKGVSQGELVNQRIVNAAISRVLQSNADWAKVLEAVHQPTLQIIVSNTTEVGIQYVEEKIKEGVPHSYPGKLLAVLLERYTHFNGDAQSGFVIVPTELVVNNGQLLQDTLLKLAAYNELPEAFIKWITANNQFCNSLVDRIVPGKPKEPDTEAGYTDQLWIDAEPYLLWAIEGDQRTRNALSFCEADSRMLITPDITPFREQKLRILNGSHTISVPLAFLNGLNTVYESMNDEYMRRFFREVITKEIVPTIQDACPQAPVFAEDVLDRFANPYIAHKLISITFQESSKMNARNVRTIVRYYERAHVVPANMCLGFAAMLLFLRPAKEENGVYYGLRGAEYYTITDDNAAIFATYWKYESIAEMVKDICGDARLWETDLNAIPTFKEHVTEHLTRLLKGTIDYEAISGC